MSVSIHRASLAQLQTLVRPRPGAIVRLLAWALLTLLFCVLSTGAAMWTARSSLQATLAEQLPARLSEALQFSFVTDGGTITRIGDSLARDLDALTVSGHLPLLRECSAELLQLTARDARRQPARDGIVGLSLPLEVTWLHGPDTETAGFSLRCELNMPVLLAGNGSLALLWLILASLLPATLSQRMLWLRQGLRQHGFHTSGIRRATASALSPAALAFDHDAHIVTIHGISVQLPKTPYFYYLWYALLRADNTDGGWLLNPAMDRPDRDTAAGLITLMTSAGGHQKAINDLKEHGLRAKILDQNRNKVKDELIRVLGQELAAPYLFEAERDPRSARYRYRLACDPALISLPRSVFKSA